MKTILGVALSVTLILSSAAAARMSDDAAGRLSIKVRTGEYIFVNDFRKTSSFNKHGDKSYYLTRDEPMVRNTFDITYTPNGDFFNVVIEDKPLSRVRRAAENFLQKKLGVTRDDMCNLNYQLVTVNSVSERYSGRPLGFSFCAGAAQLP